MRARWVAGKSLPAILVEREKFNDLRWLATCRRGASSAGIVMPPINEVIDVVNDGGDTIDFGTQQVRAATL
jgi:hypothetical protein